MEIGIDSFASAKYGRSTLSSVDAMEQLLDRISAADEAGLDIFSIGEHHKKEFLDSAPAVILSAAAARTKRIHFSSAVTVLSTSDPVRVYQSFATLDLISKGRAELVVGRGSATEAYPLFGFGLNDYTHCLKKNWICC
jgi:alkanesulfonate monooxygenase SsuD/methylene tetrahydromethanopterin reductase-like flavin-dependent oxidoreductase (luciferase family)